MGFYLETPESRRKADQLIGASGAIERLATNAWPAPDGFMVVVVVSNPFFDAAGIAFDKQEFDEFTDPDDNRPKRFLWVSNEYIKAQKPHLSDAVDGIVGWRAR